MMIGKMWCAVMRRLGNGRHAWRDGRCARCGRKQAKPRLASMVQGGAYLDSKL
jgi:hypothetical protein